MKPVGTRGQDMGDWLALTVEERGSVSTLAHMIRAALGHRGMLPAFRDAIGAHLGDPVTCPPLFRVFWDQLTNERSTW